MIDGFDYLPFVRPYPHRWHYMAKRMLRPVRSAGGFRPRIWATEPMIGAATTPNAPLVPRSFRDFYLPVVPGSEIYMIGVTGAGTLAAAYFARQSIEFEIIDACTKEAWFRTSEDSTNLAGGVSQEAVTTAITAVANFVENEPMGFTKYFLCDKRVIVGTGIQVVRIVNGKSTQATIQAQLAMFCMEPLKEGRDSQCEI